MKFGLPLKTYLAIDLKSFYASVECVERGLDPLTTNLVVADESRTNKTICLAVSPSLKAYGIGGRARLFEVEQRVAEIKARQCKTIEYIVAPPRMALYLEYSHRIRDIYKQFVSEEDIHVYSVDEVFMDVTNYLAMYKCSARELCTRIIRRVLAETGITATAGIGTNLYLSKVAMDIVAKHTRPDEYGVRIAELDENSYRQQLWNHQPLTDFWRIGRGISNRLALCGITTMGQLARYSLTKADYLYDIFGVNAELLIDHAWGWEPVEMHDIKSYRSASHSLSSGQVLKEPYDNAKARVVIMEMADNLAMDMFEDGLETGQIVLTVSYDASNMLNSQVRKRYAGHTRRDHYGREVPEHSHGTANLPYRTNSSRIIMAEAAKLFDRITDKSLTIRYLNICAEKVTVEGQAGAAAPVQLDLFAEPKADESALKEKDKRLQKAIMNIRRRYGKNAALRGLNFSEGATAIERNKQIGGHKA